METGGISFAVITRRKCPESEDPKWHPGALTRSVGNNTSHKEDIAYAAC